MLVEKADKVEQVRIVKRTVFKTFQPLQVAVAVIHDKIVGRTVHPVDKLSAFIDNRFPLPPCQYRREEAGDFDILLARKPVWDAYRIIFDKPRPVIFVHFPVEEIF